MIKREKIYTELVIKEIEVKEEKRKEIVNFSKEEKDTLLNAKEILQEMLDYVEKSVEKPIFEYESLNLFEKINDLTMEINDYSIVGYMGDKND